MPDWLDRLRGKRAPAADPAPGPDLLAGYPPFEGLHPGHGRQLTEAQAAENWACFERERPRRLADLSRWLATHAGIDTAAALAEPRRHAAALTDDLHRWALQAWPLLHRPDLARQAAWLASRRRGEEVVFALLLDLAILLGEVIRRGNPDWRWGLDLDAGNLADDMLSARRIVMLADPVGAMQRPFVIDVEDVVVATYLQPDAPHHRLMNPWRRLVEEGLSGAAMAYWRGTLGAPGAGGLTPPAGS